MNTRIKLAAAGILASIALLPEAIAQDQRRPASLKTIEVAQGSNKITYTEVLPHLWVRGQPAKPITSGSFLIIPEAYDYLPRGDGAGR